MGRYVTKYGVFILKLFVKYLTKLGLPLILFGIFSLYGDYRALSVLSQNQEKLIVLFSDNVDALSLPKSTQDKIINLKSSIDNNQAHNTIFNKPTPIIGIVLIIFGALLSFSSNSNKGVNVT